MRVDDPKFITSFSSNENEFSIRRESNNVNCLVTILFLFNKPGHASVTNIKYSKHSLSRPNKCFSSILGYF